MANMLDQDRVRWPGTGTDCTSTTVPYGYYCNEEGCDEGDSTFEIDCKASEEWAAVRLGYPVVEISMTYLNFHACFEQAVLEYNRQINEFNIINNMKTLMNVNTTTYTNLSGVTVNGSALPFIVKISRMYGTEAELGGRVELKRGYIPVKGSIGNQVYDLNKILKEQDPDIGTSDIEIRRVFHYRMPASARIYDPYSMTGMSYSNVLTEMGFMGYSPATQFLMTPISEDITRIQAIELNDTIRKSHYSFEIVGDNMIRLFPIPQHDFKCYIDYYIIDKKPESEIQKMDNTGNSSYSHVSDPSNVPYQNCKYCKLNQAAKQWIRRYFLALCKETLGLIRQKYREIPIPGASVVLDGAELRQEAQQDKDALIKELREYLEKTLNVNQFENAEREANAMNKVLSRVPLGIYIG